VRKESVQEGIVPWQAGESLTVQELGTSGEKMEPGVLQDWKAAYAALESGEVEQLRGQFVAVFDRQVIGHGPDQEILRAEMAQSKGVDPERIVIMYVDSSETYSDN
jgi:hypothetical protein